MSAGDEDFYKQIMDLVLPRVKDVDFQKGPEAVDPLIRSLTHAAAHLCLIGGVSLPDFIAGCVAEAEEASECVAQALRGTSITRETGVSGSLSKSLEDLVKGLSIPTNKDPDDGLKN
jgi:hypothetical protein